MHKKIPLIKFACKPPCFWNWYVIYLNNYRVIVVFLRYKSTRTKFFVSCVFLLLQDFFFPLIFNSSHYSIIKFFISTSASVLQSEQAMIYREKNPYMKNHWNLPNPTGKLLRQRKEGNQVKRQSTAIHPIGTFRSRICLGSPLRGLTIITIKQFAIVMFYQVFMLEIQQH